MTVAKVTEITSSSKKSFEDAIENGVERAAKTVKHIQSAWVADQSVRVENGKVTDYQVRLKLTFVIEE